MELNQEQMAEKAKLHRTQLGDLEKGKAGATVDSLYLLGQAIGVPASVLLEPPEEALPKILSNLPKKRRKR